MKIDRTIQLLKYRRTKIIATIGPSSSSPEDIRSLIEAGVDLFRMNMSHGEYETHRDVYHQIRVVSAQLDKPTAVIADLSGPKIRVGRFEEGRIELKSGEAVTVTTRDVNGSGKLIPSGYKDLHLDVVPGSTILLDDGNIKLNVERVDGTEILCTVVDGGPLSDHKGMNLPNVRVSAPSLTEKDRNDARFALGLGVDFLALSFVRQAKDIEELRQLIEESGFHAASIIAKIEKPEALDNIEGIIKAADGIMVARGDLGVELAPELVPAAQDQLVDLAQKHRKPVIIATQMLESMISNPRPTRAEVSDVATAVRTGVDAVMLSGETSVGRHPVEAVRMMDHVARQTEGHLWRLGFFGSLSNPEHTERPLPLEDAIAEAAARLSRDLMVRAIVAISMNDHSVAIISSSKPAAPIVGLSSDSRVSSVSNLLWGVIPVTVRKEELEAPHVFARRIVRELGLAEENQKFLVIQGFTSDPDSHVPNIAVVTA